MEEIFIIESIDDSDYYNIPNVIDFRLSEDEAKSVVGYLKKRKELIKTLCDEYYSLERVMDTTEEPVYHEIPKWAAGLSDKDITPEMRKERIRLKDENHRMRESFKEKVAERREEARKVFREKLDLRKDISDDVKESVLRGERIYVSYRYSKVTRKSYDKITKEVNGSI